MALRLLTSIQASTTVVIAGSLLVGCGQPTFPVVDQGAIGTTTVPTLEALGEEPGLGDAIEPDSSFDSEITVDDSLANAGGQATFATGVAWEDVTANLVGLESTCGNVSYVSVDPDDGTVIAGIAANGLWEWQPDGGAWAALGDGGGSDTIVNRTAWIEYDPLVAERFWEAGTYGDGVFRTDDGGVTFQQLGDVQSVDSISVDLTDELRRTMLAGAHERSALYLSVDGGNTWTDLAVVLPDDVGFTSYALVLDAQTLLVGSYRGAEAGIHRSENGGLTWSSVFELPVAANAVRGDDAVYWLLEDGRGVAVSRDGGQTFEVGGPTGGSPRTLSRLGDGTLVTHADEQLLVSGDGGTTWDAVGPPLPFEPNGVTVSEDGGSAYAWQFTCNFDESGNPVTPGSIVRLDFAAA